MIYSTKFKCANKNADLEKCTHALRLGTSLCAICGAETLENISLFAASHTSDEIFKTSEAAHKEQQIKNEKLYKKKKIILILDLDQTLIHTTMINMPCDLKYRFGEKDYYTKYRPYLKSFLKKANKLFEMHIYTMGSREYADKICQGIDPTGKLFNGRIVSRDENFNELKKSISRISCIDDNVIILDDRADVWNYVTNLILVKPYYYYNNIDINDPSIIRQNRDFWIQDKNILVNDNSQITNLCLKNNYQITSESYIVPENETHKNIKKTPFIDNDKELLRIYNTLKKIHKKYFAKEKKACELVKLSFLRGKKICSFKNHDLIEFIGGTIDFLNPDYVIENSIYAKKYECINISMDWIYESIFRRRLLNINKFIIEDFRNKENEELNEFIKEFS